jgi:hypothetical protein
MATFTKKILSGSTDGKAVKVAANCYGWHTHSQVRLQQQPLMRFGCTQ